MAFMELRFWWSIFYYGRYHIFPHLILYLLVIFFALFLLNKETVQYFSPRQEDQKIPRQAGNQEGRHENYFVGQKKKKNT